MKPQTPQEYSKSFGRRFRRTKEQMKRGLDRDASFKEWLEIGDVPTETKVRPTDQPRIRRTKDEIKRELTIEEAFNERKKSGTLDRDKVSPIREISGLVCDDPDKNCKNDSEILNQCPGFKLYKDDDGVEVIMNCMCECHKMAYQRSLR
jgi:hypothetical protein